MRIIVTHFKTGKLLTTLFSMMISYLILLVACALPCLDTGLLFLASPENLRASLNEKYKVDKEICKARIEKVKFMFGTRIVAENKKTTYINWRRNERDSIVFGDTVTVNTAQ